MSSEEEHFSSDSSHDLFISSTLKRRGSTSDSEIENNCNDNDKSNDTDQEWTHPVGNQPRLKFFEGTPGIQLHSEVLACNEVADFYSLLVTEEIFETIAEQTNLFATQILLQKQLWVPTDKYEIKRFFGLIVWMGLVKLPNINLYWSEDIAFQQVFARTTMDRNRFELLLRLLHFSNNEETINSNRLCKIQVIIDALNTNFQKYYSPAETVCVDESVIPFRGRQRIKQKRHKYGIKIFKLYTTPGYTYGIEVYCGKKQECSQTISATNIVMRLCKDILDKGHTLCTDSWCTSVDLANKLLAHDTHLVGTLRGNRCGIPKDVLSKRLKQDELIARENKNGITVLKWKSKRDVLLLSTKHSTEMVPVDRKGNICMKPKIILDFKEGNSSVDISDQMSAYSSPLRQTIKWYKKIALELLLNTAVVNAMIIYNSVKGKRMSAVGFRKELAMHLTRCQDDAHGTFLSAIITPMKRRHEIQEREGQSRQVRRQCKRCYEQNVKKFGRQFARNRTVKVVTFCESCDGEPHFCLRCFNIVHRDM